jgi:hypothetical protein
MDDLGPIRERPVPEEEAEKGASHVDDSLILWMLSLTPTERLAVAQGFVDSIYALRNGRP